MFAWPASRTPLMGSTNTIGLGEYEKDAECIMPYGSEWQPTGKDCKAVVDDKGQCNAYTVDSQGNKKPRGLKRADGSDCSGTGSYRCLQTGPTGPDNPSGAYC